MRQRIIRSHQKRRGGAKDHSTRPSQDSFVLQLNSAAQIIILLDQSEIVFVFGCIIAIRNADDAKFHFFGGTFARFQKKPLDVSEPVQSSGERRPYNRLNE
jgi:hypothetical protein